jgi:hypothetical protein
MRGNSILTPGKATFAIGKTALRKSRSRHHDLRLVALCPSGRASCFVSSRITEVQTHSANVKKIKSREGSAARLPRPGDHPHYDFVARLAARNADDLMGMVLDTISTLLKRANAW